MNNEADIKSQIGTGRRKSVNILYVILHLLMLALSIFLIISISIDTFRGEYFYGQPRFMKTQLWICVVFLPTFL